MGSTRRGLFDPLATPERAARHQVLVQFFERLSDDLSALGHSRVFHLGDAHDRDKLARILVPFLVEDRETPA